MIKDEITTAISDLLSEVKNKKIKEFAQNLLDILLVIYAHRFDNLPSLIGENFLWKKY